MEARGGSFTVYLSSSDTSKLEALKGKYKIEGTGYSTIIRRLIEETSVTQLPEKKKLAIKKKV